MWLKVCVFLNIFGKEDEMDLLFFLTLFQVTLRGTSTQPATAQMHSTAT